MLELLINLLSNIKGFEQKIRQHLQVWRHLKRRGK